MKTIIALLLAVTALAVNAKPVFEPLPGTPEYDALVARQAKSPAKTGPVITDAVIPAAPAAVKSTQLPSSPVRYSPPQPAQPVPVIGNPAPIPVANPVVPAPAPAPATPAPAPAPAAAKPPEEMIGVSALRFQNAPLEQVLDFYAIMVNRTILRSATLPNAQITIKAQTELTKTEALQALDAVLGMNQVVLIPVGTKFLKVVAQAQAGPEVGAINTNSAEELPEFGGYITQIIQLKYTKPTEIIPFLQPFAKAGPPQGIDSNGILIIRDYTENVKRMLELIAQIDVSVPSEIVSEVIPIKYALAGDIASALNSVGGASTGSVGGGGATTGAGAGVTGRRSNGTGGPQTIGGGSGGYPGGGGGNGFSRLSNPGVPAAGGGAGQPQTFQDRLRSIISKAASGAAGDFQLIGPNKIIPDERTNSLLVFAGRNDMEMIKSIIEKLDVVLAQVLIEAIILDVTLADNFNLGVSAGQAPIQLGKNGSVIGGGGINNGNGSLTTGQAFLNNLINTATGSNAPSFSASTNFINFPASDGLSYFGKIGPTWNVAIEALAGKNNVKVLARPSIQTSHAVPANIFVGETRPYITGTYNNGYNGGNTSQYQQSQIGISLNVTPLINPDGLVVMDIQQQVQQVGGSVTIDGNSVPITQDQNASSKVAVRNGETIVMGGFIQDQKSDSKSGVPFLQDIPWLGALFRSTTTSGSRRELLVMIRPTVLKTPEVAALNTQVQLDRHPQLKEANAAFQKEEKHLLKHANKTVKPDAAFSPLPGETEPPAATDAEPAEDK